MEDYFDDYEEEDLYEDYDFDKRLLFPFSRQTLEETFKNCVLPSLSQIATYAGTLIGWNLLCRLAWLMAKCAGIRPWVDHLISFVTGCGVLYYTIGLDFLVVLLFAMVSYVILSILEYRQSRSTGYVMGAICIVGLFLYELLAENPTVWHKIRGVQMIATMKVVSLAFDLDAKKHARTPALFPFLGYMLCPANAVLGPWMAYDEYTVSLDQSRIEFRWFLWTVSNSLASLGFLLLSNCFVALICTDYASKWIIAFRDALSFRCSHYFISFLSQATMAAAGVHTSQSFGDKSRIFGSLVTKPCSIEVPRSLTEVVRNWNIPMHRWLKTYVFRTIKNRSTLAAIICTYVVSSLLHGLHFQIYAVLLSLGIFTFIEFQLRSKIASIFGACILPNPCRQRACSHEHKWKSTFSLVMNSVFGLLTMMHLAYLGIMMEGTSSPNAQANRFSIQAGFNKWMSLDFLSHWIFACSYLFYLVV
ncbi:protein-serine O-palmitoleoyltransferase porcupine [Eupeodes corollae]|uniref:protein-serine O-palmitoleoyltransferase porcupine n=1 Tax=Eupeodes corollae TaxID=290404 RepID=UPI00248F55E1|nr:protein-serine O-palmitoleoyltransferase porcupine [Eupeodes corollae]